MQFKNIAILRIIPIFALLFASLSVPAQSGNAGAVRGAVTDSTGAVIPGASVHMTNEVSGLDRTVITDANGQFSFSNVPFNGYRIRVSANGFSPLSQSAEIQLCGGHKFEIGPPGCRGLADRDSRVVRRSCRRRTQHSTPMWIAICSPRFRLRAQSSTLSSLVTRDHARRSGRFKRPVSRTGRPRLEFLLGGRPVDHRPAEQGFFQPASLELDSIDRGDLWRAAGRIWRQDQPGHCGHDAVRTGRDQADGRHQYARTVPSDRRRAASISPTAARTGATLLRPTA